MAGETGGRGVASRNKLIAIGVSILVGAFAIGYFLGDRKPVNSEPAAEPVPVGGPMNAKPLARLEDLLPALEAKVAANPNDIDKRTLLARTYLEMGLRDKGIAALRSLRRDVPQDTEIVILLATALTDGSGETELREAYRTYDDAVRLKPAAAPMARLYQGEVLLKLGDRQGALRLWKDYVRALPAGDQRRAPFEERINAVTAG
jgi:cytochrome c-type biogenesis protein CcmH/NrfG